MILLAGFWQRASPCHWFEGYEISFNLTQLFTCFKKVQTGRSRGRRAVDIVQSLLWFNRPVLGGSSAGASTRLHEQPQIREVTARSLRSSCGAQSASFTSASDKASLPSKAAAASQSLMCTEYLQNHKEAEMHILDQRSVLAEGRSNGMKMSLRPRCCLVKFGSIIGLGNREGTLPSLYIIHLNDPFIFLCNASIRQYDYYESAHVMRSLSELLGHALILVENCSNQLNRSERDSSHE